MKLKTKKARITKSYLCHPKEVRLYQVGSGESLKDLRKGIIWSYCYLAVLWRKDAEEEKKKH